VQEGAREQRGRAMCTVILDLCVLNHATAAYRRLQSPVPQLVKLRSAAGGGTLTCREALRE